MEILKKADEISEYLNVLGASDFMRLKSDNYGWFKQDKFILPFIMLKDGVYKSILFPTGTILLEDNISLDEERSFLAEVVIVARELGAHFINSPYPYSIFRTFPEGSINIPFGTYVNDLTKDERLLWLELPKNNRNRVRKAQNDGVEIVSGPDQIELCHEIIKDTMARQGLSWWPKEYYYQINRQLKDNVVFYASLKNGRPQTVMFVLWNKWAAYPFHAGSIVKPSPGANNYLHWRVMLDMKMRGVREYNLFGVRVNPEKGSRAEAIQSYKRRFGGELRMGYLWKYALNRPLYRLYEPYKFLRTRLWGRYYPEDIINGEKRRSNNGGWK